MILLDATNSKEIFYIIEVIIIIAVIIYQIYISSKINESIKELSRIFDHKYTVVKGFFDKSRVTISPNIVEEVRINTKGTLPYLDSSGFPVNEVDVDNLIELSLVETKSRNRSNQRIKHTLNSYLINNYGGAVNFSIIKDIIDREVDVNDESISQSLPIPLYLGLAATMIGIIFGLFSMPNVDGNDFTQGINSLINGVKVAMLASLIGLACTSVLSSFIYKNAKRNVLLKKNDLLSYLQASLLPELVKAEEIGLTGLKYSLDRFVKEAATVSATALQASNKTNENILRQNELVEKIDKLSMSNTSRINLELFDRIENNFQALEKFNGYITALNQISENMLGFAKQTTDIKAIASEIRENIKSSNEVMSLITNHSAALTAHVKTIENSGLAARDAVNIADSAFREGIDKLQQEIENRMKLLNSSSNILDVNLQEHFQNIGLNLKEVATAYQNELIAVLHSSIPNFDKLNSLIALPELIEDYSKNSRVLIETLQQFKAVKSSPEHQVNNVDADSRIQSKEKEELKLNDILKDFWSKLIVFTKKKSQKGKNAKK